MGRIGEHRRTVIVPKREEVVPDRLPEKMPETAPAEPSRQEPVPA